MNENSPKQLFDRHLVGSPPQYCDERKIYCSNDVRPSTSIFRVMKLLIPWKWYLCVAARSNSGAQIKRKQKKNRIWMAASRQHILIIIRWDEPNVDVDFVFFFFLLSSLFSFRFVSFGTTQTPVRVFPFQDRSAIGWTARWSIFLYGFRQSSRIL